MDVNSQPANISLQDVPSTSPSNVPRTSSKHPFWPFRGCPNLTSQGCFDLTSQGRPESTFQGHILVEVLSTPFEEPAGKVLKHIVGSSVACPLISFYIFSKLNAIIRGVFRTQSSICDGALLQKQLTAFSR